MHWFGYLVKPFPGWFLRFRVSLVLARLQRFAGWGTRLGSGTCLGSRWGVRLVVGHCGKSSGHHLRGQIALAALPRLAPIGDPLIVGEFRSQVAHHLRQDRINVFVFHSHTLAHYAATRKGQFVTGNKRAKTASEREIKADSFLAIRYMAGYGHGVKHGTTSNPVDGGASGPRVLHTLVTAGAAPLSTREDNQMSISITLPEALVETVVKGIMENFPEASHGSGLACTGWEYDAWKFSFEDDNGKGYELDKSELIAAFALVFTDKWPKGCTQPPASTNLEVWDNWLCQCDATDFDAFAQLACLGEVMYG